MSVRPRFGANYTPSRGWFHHWLDFEPAEVCRDLDSLAELGLDHVRVFALWPVFQPNRAVVRPKAVEQLGQLVDAAGERGLDVAVDGLQGHLSSFDFVPSWLHSWHRRNMFTDPEALAGQARYLRTLAAELAPRPNFIGMTLGNEVNQFSDRPHPDPDGCTPEQAGRWIEHLLAQCEQAAPGRLHVHSEYDAVWYQDGHPFTPAYAARLGGATTVHSWVFNGTAQRYGRRGTATVRHAEYLVELARAWAVDPRRPVWLQEIGAPAPLIPPEHAAEFAEATLTTVLDCAELYGITWWCSHDVSRELADFPELEYSLGLLTNERKAKPVARVIAELAAADHPVPAPRRTALVLDTGNRADCAPGGVFFEAWMRLAADGARPAIVLPGQQQDRGITEVVYCSDLT